MTTWVLTPKSPDPVTGLQNPAVGWHLTASTALDVLAGMGVVGAIGYHQRLESIDITVSPPIYQLTLSKGNLSVVVNDTDWFVCDGRNAWAIPETKVTAGYTVTQKT